MLRYLILLLFPAFALAQSPSTPCRDSVDIWMDLLNQDSLIYRPDGDSLITLIAKSENKRGVLFLLDHLHKRDDKYAPMFGDMQIDAKQRFWIEDILDHNCNMWFLSVCIFDYLETHENINKDKAFRILILFNDLENDLLKNILQYEYFHSSGKIKRNNISLLMGFLNK